MMFMAWNILCLLFVIHNIVCLVAADLSYEACSTGSISTGNPGEVAYITLKEKRKKCELRITTCTACKLELFITELELLPCNKIPPSAAGCLSQCDFISVHEPAHFTSRTVYISNDTALDWSYTSETRLLEIQFCLSSDAKFKLKYIVTEKVQVFATSNPGYFTSPGFPCGYKPSGDIYHYIINNTGTRYVHLEFTDWNIANDSKITIYYADAGNNGHNLTVFGSEPRPYVESQGSVLTVVFETGSRNHVLNYLGFRAEYKFTDPRDWPRKPYNYNCGQYFSLSWGGSFSFTHKDCQKDQIMDCVWVVKRYPMAAYSDYVWLRIYDVLLENGDVLEVRSGNNSQGILQKTLTQITSTPSDFTELDAIYIHLRAPCKDNRLFKAAFVSYDNAQKKGLTYKCPYPMHFACQNQRCISKSLKCDGINHCADWSDERNCPNMCSACHNGIGWYCAADKCNGIEDCSDGSDEEECMFASTTYGLPLIQSNHYYWGTITPVVLISLILGIITCIVISYYIRRKRLLRERSRCLTRTQSHVAGRNNVLVESLGLSPGVYGIAPPTYEEALSAQYIPSQGTVNTAFDGPVDFPAQPPPYTPKCDNNLPIQYLPPYVIAQTPTITDTEHVRPARSGTSQNESVSRSVTLEQGSVASRSESRLTPGSSSCEGGLSAADRIRSDSGANADRQQAASIAVPQAETVQAVLAGCGALSGISHSNLLTSDASKPQPSLIDDSPSLHDPNTSTVTRPERPPPPNIRSREGQILDGQQLTLGADNEAFESDDSVVMNSDANISAPSEPQDHNIGLSSDGHHDINDSMMGDEDAIVSQGKESQQLPDELHTTQGFTAGSAVIIEETGDVFV